ncbi:hypothetical protein COU62_00370 [Candidatus Pacearchaeota archaeon CG10_big_fil_rev_8_21_14_0_10_35_219]|nr:hypothetical protein [Candidatus Pacearchaeota archaeon]OIO42184.1 MAG: hypothetical protein AUJ63_02795 [Candidatus Pacearchaeota archaeon CG1_02_35_32]PIO08403.1 MAG: hypothetical protein COU62_00370 [Candidatus Pacearchaeota archaeon CG10_big_fil_rev_8_21_14_0_10_35_219]PIY81765.1 MAG: hypothetical protein COY79_00915 [Candidatus Pacearchaeota archaeon CG_4_10_14_0_8_um_filter_35_169]PIZ80845.1 MAG: hypothetical protein COY00_00335 [Candidatus Pacearchaeota archaeon CG_4_10_14_0_2_um_filt
MATVLQSAYFVELVLPFLLIFVVVFGILQKTKIFGDNKKQIDALVALVLGLIVVAFANAVNIILNLVPFMAIGVVIILIFMIMYGMLFKEGDFDMNKWLKFGIGTVIMIALIIAVLVVTGGWDYIVELFYGKASGDLVANVVMVVIVMVALVLVVVPFGKKKEKKKDE